MEIWWDTWEGWQTPKICWLISSLTKYRVLRKSTTKKLKEQSQSQNRALMKERWTFSIFTIFIVIVFFLNVLIGAFFCIRYCFYHIVCLILSSYTTVFVYLCLQFGNTLIMSIYRNCLSEWNYFYYEYGVRSASPRSLVVACNVN